MANLKDNLKFLDALTDALGQSDEQSLDEVKAELRDEGVDVEASVKRFMKSVNGISMKAKRQQLDVARGERQKSSIDFPAMVKKFADWSREQIIARIKENITFLGRDVSFAHRELESFDDAEIQSLAEDLEFARARHEQERSDDE